MSNSLLHILELSIALSALYLIYRLLLLKETSHKLNRFALIMIPMIALMVTLIRVNIPSELSEYYTQIVHLADEPDEIDVSGLPQLSENLVLQQDDQNIAVTEIKTGRQIPCLFLLFSTVSIILLIRLIIQNLKLVRIIKSSNVHPSGKLRLVEVDREISPFSYFRYVFLNPRQHSISDLKNILSHECIHYIQRHSWDNLYLELIGLLQWFNPFYWLLRASLKETHEYLADEGALNLGIDRTDYQVLLLNQVAEGQLVAIACNFSQSLTKKRIMMMQKTKKTVQRSITRLFFVMPVIVVLTLIFSCDAQIRQKQKHVAAISPTKMNVLYLGADNLLAIAVSGVAPEEISVETDNGKIQGELGRYVASPGKAGTATIRVYKIKKGKKDLLQETEFRVKTIPDPVAFIAGRKGGRITKEELLNANEVQVDMENFDFDLNFKVVEFVLSATFPGTYTIREEISKSNTFSETQIDLIKSLVKNQKVYFENIVIIGPDSIKRKIGTVGFEISE